MMPTTTFCVEFELSGDGAYIEAHFCVCLQMSDARLTQLVYTLKNVIVVVSLTVVLVYSAMMVVDADAHSEARLDSTRLAFMHILPVYVASIVVMIVVGRDPANCNALMLCVLEHALLTGGVFGFYMCLEMAAVKRIMGRCDTRDSPL
jgi:cytochrome bd-type quinol oxidase subunit 2